MNRFRLSVVTMILVLASTRVMADNDLLKVLFELAGKSKNWMEGFKKNTGDNTFSYQTFRSDVTDCLLTRCTNGTMGVEWETQPLPGTFEQNTVGFIWMAAIDLTTDKNIFDLSVNGIKRFEIPSTLRKNWQIETPDGGKLSFVTVETDQNQDAHGYMSLEAPSGWLQKGASQKVGITGRANQSNIWMIVFQAPDALAYLQNSIKYDTWMIMEAEEKNGHLSCLLKGPVFLAGNDLSLSVSGKTRKIRMEQVENNGEASFTIPVSAKNKPFKLNDPQGEVFVVQSLGEDFKTTRILNKALLFNESNREGAGFRLQAQRTYQPKTVSSMLNLSNSILGKGQIFLMNSSHQDIAWMDSPEKCVIERDTMLLAPLFKMAEKDKNYRFDIEDALMIKEYTERHPEKKVLVKALLNEGRISCGSTFIQPYEEMYSGEALARQFYFGAKWLKDEFNYKATVYWNEDVPGRTLQMSQLMRKSGTKFMMISRHKRGFFNWYSPDGSFVTVYSPGHYGDAYPSLQKNFHEAAQFVATRSLEWEKYYTSQTPSPVIPLLSDQDMSPPKDYTNLIQSWGNIHELQDENGAYLPVKLPRLKVASTPEFFEALMVQKPELPAVNGERPDVWLYIHGPSHQKALKASREADILLPVAEKFASVNALVEGSFRDYPQARLRKAWEAKIYPDHGWGGKHGDITDDYFLSKYVFAKAEAEKILDKSLNELASKIQTDSKKGRSLVVFNSMNQLRTDPVTTVLNFEKGETFTVELFNAEGTRIVNQLSLADHFEDGSIKSAQLHFIAEKVPSIGYRTYYVKPAKKGIIPTNPAFKNQVENKYYRLSFADGGLSSIFDKELGQELIDSNKFKAGEIFTMRSEGNGAGEFADIQKPDMTGFDKTGNYPTKWEIEEDGDVYTCYKYRQKIRYAVVEQHIKLFHQQKRIDFETGLLNWEGVLYREFRMALPLNMTDGKVSYEVPFGVVEVGKDEIEGAAGERYQAMCKNVHPRGIENWISASNGGFGVTMSSSVAVADWIDPTNQPVSNQILQPILLASRKSCHWEGNEYLQTGNHTFSFSITSHLPGWQNGALFGRQSNERLMAVQSTHHDQNGTLPESLSFFKTDQEKVFVSTIKKAEDSDDVIIRIADMEGKDQSVTIESFKNIRQAMLTNLIEEDVKTLQVNGKKLNILLNHHAVETIKLK